MTELLSVSGLTKRFGPVIANDDISISVRSGEVHCIFGENGAGKSTLSGCLYGMLQPDAGSMVYKGNPMTLRSPANALKLGIGMVHQHFVLVEAFSVLENIVVGAPGFRTFADQANARQKVLDLCGECGVELDMDRKVWELSVGEKQWVEIIKAIYLGAEVLILDEPTAVLTPQQSDKLFAVIGKMRGRGMGIILISHKLREVMQSDRVSVLRRGRIVKVLDTPETSPDELVALMVGHKVVQATPDREHMVGNPVLELEGVCARDEWGDEVLHDVTLSVAEGEILGLAGVAGNGQKPLYDVLMGVLAMSAGRYVLDGEEVTGATPRQMLDRGIGFIPDDRFREGLVPTFGIDDNIVLGWHRSALYRKGMFVDRQRIGELAQEAINEYGIATAKISQPVGRLSGGNAQRVILAREFLHSRTLILANQPTRGLDIAASEFVYRKLLTKREEGSAILLASEELDDLIRLCDRIAVLYRGKVVGIVGAKNTSPIELGLMMSGHGLDEPGASA